jgi:four helix bundle protein
LEPTSANAGIQQRSYELGLRIVRMIKAMGRDAASLVLARQVVRSGTSVGANVEEAQGSHSKAEFVRRMNIARSEARETLYWLRLIADAELLPRRRMNELLGEAEQIVRILVAIVKKSRETK